MLWFIVWLAFASPEVQVTVQTDSRSGDAASGAAPAAAPAPTIYTCFLDYDGDHIVDCDLRPELCRRDPRTRLITTRKHFLDELMQLADADLRPLRP